MKKAIIGTFSKLGVVMGLAVVLTAAAFGQANSAETKTGYTNNESALRQINLKARTNKVPGGKIAKSLGENVSASNQANYMIGTNFVWAVMSSASYDRSKDDFTQAVEDLVYLIESMDGEPEAEALKKTLRSVLQNTTNSERVLKELIDASKSYSARLNEEQRWYYVSGMTVTNLAIDVYFKDDTSIKKGLQTIQLLVENAPQGTSLAIIRSMKNLVTHVSQTTFATEDYNALMEGTKDIAKSINA